MYSAVLGVVVVVLSLAVLGLWVLLFQVLRQQGQLLLRLDALEAGSDADQAPGLPVGAPIAPFRLPDLRGNLVGLEDYRGNRVLLLHWNPDCGYCELIAPDVAAAQAGLRTRGVELVLISYGDVERNRRHAEEYGLRCPVLLQREGETVSEFEPLGTPVAYLLDEDGRVARAVAAGADRVLELVRELSTGRSGLPTQRPLSESRLVRDGLPAGTPAPGFTLPALDGSTVSLQDYAGRRVLLVFSDPTCGPCEEMLPELVELHQRLTAQGVALILVTRGDPEQNRAKYAEHQIPFPIVLQPGWRLSKDYGIFATPVAFLISEKAVIERDVAQGAQQIVELASAAMASRREAPIETH